MAAGAVMKPSSGFALRKTSTSIRKRVPSVRCEFSCGEHHGGLNGLDSIEAPEAEVLSPSHHKAEDQRAYRSLVFYLGRKDGYWSSYEVLQ